MMSEKTIPVDCGAWITAQGVEVYCYFGNSCEPFVTTTETFEDLIDKELEAHTVRGVFPPRDLDSVHELLESLKGAVEYAEKRIKELTPSD